MDVSRKTTFTKRIVLVVTALCSGGTVMSSCEARFKDAVVGGSKDFIGAILTSPDTTTALLTQLGFVQEENADDDLDESSEE
jgi:hypothetical protein